MGSMPWLLIAIAILIIIFGVVAIIAAKKGKQRAPDYYAFFWIGLMWTIIGLPIYNSTNNLAFLGMGIVFLVVGLIHKDKWKENRVKWNDLGKNEKNLKLGISIFLGILLLAGLVTFYFVKRRMLNI